MKNLLSTHNVFIYIYYLIKTYIYNEWFCERFVKGHEWKFLIRKPL